ncbi:DUF305 domain-containing protein [Kutzneria viridogrisea]|uniref:DUF305 domain-containing protein n=2 Tax=Kutzneria TaxID=43356 RepID=W5W7Q1_9PSEU|nr:DUF305 domain-containing protein [Kutzneria albida]AHH96750.1 hypothetical protein KALB_3383 [Kutzneria albida DSM 43870]MBA8928031.1 uncharacterized protein (DUF305 family) [Kutzneria viridogrisea]
MTRLALALLTAGLLAAAGCASTPHQHQHQAPAAATAEFNAQDVMFLQMMIPHHGQGVQLADLAARRATQPGVRTLAAAIKSTELTEVDTMKSWLTQWKQPLAMSGSMSGHTGMTATDQSFIDEVAKAGDQDFERRFLDLLSGHQGNAAEMAREEVKSGQSKQVKDFADRIDKSRTAQVKQLLTFTGELGTQSG